MYQENFYNFTIVFQTYTAPDITTEVQKICEIIEQFHLTSNSKYKFTKKCGKMKLLAKVEFSDRCYE